ncbi:MAG: shikimate kinase [Ruminococcus sp.]|nr:shikimate kinase [Ruminococcus sp.]
MNKDKEFGLLGEHLSHSFSPLIHSQLADYPYALYEVARESLGEWVKGNDLSGYNVTIPYKQEIMKYCDEISDVAQRIGAVNTVVRREDGTLFGDNTDYYGFAYMLSKLGADIKGKKAVVLGSGGASKTVQAVLTEQGAEVIVISRSGDNNYDNISNHKDAFLLVNTTPVGMYPDCPKSPVDLKTFENLQGVCDVIYNPAKTALLLQAEKLSIPYVNGLSMLVAQAKRAAEIFTSAEIDASVVERIERKISYQTKNIVLVGMPGSGKSTVGKLVAEVLGRELADSDEEIKRVTRTSASEIIKSKGEREFRKTETQVLADICKESSLVIATGGGAVTVASNKDLLKQNSVVVFIDRDVNLLATDDRPLSVNLSELYEKRLPMYEDFADIKVDGNKSTRAVADDIIKAFKEVL